MFLNRIIYSIKHLNISIRVTLIVALMLLLFSSCSNKKKQFATAISEKDSLPSLHTTGVTTYISDSGVVRYKIITEDWKIFDKKAPPYWSFEKGVYLEKFDSVFHIDASIKADTAYYYTNKKLWELKGNVNIKNIKGDKFITSQMFWDERNQEIHSDKKIRIEQYDKSIIVGEYGFKSNQQLTDYEIFNSSGEFTVKDTPADTTKNDSIKK